MNDTISQPTRTLVDPRDSIMHRIFRNHGIEKVELDDRVAVHISELDPRNVQELEGPWDRGDFGGFDGGFCRVPGGLGFPEILTGSIDL